MRSLKGRVEVGSLVVLLGTLLLMPSSSSDTSMRSDGGSPPPAPPPREATPDPVDPEDVSFVPSPEVVAAYNAIMAARLPAIEHAVESSPAPAQPPPPAAPPAVESDGEDESAALGRPMTKAEKQNAKKKRRKERERVMRELAAAAAAPPVAPAPVEQPTVRPVILSQVEDYPITPNPRLAPLSPAIQSRIRRVAAEAAVHAEALLAAAAPSLSIHPPQLALAVARAPPPIFVSSDATKCLAVPRVELFAQASGAAAPPKKPARRRRRSNGPREHPPPRLWRPTPGTGGKSAGYAYGWRRL